MRSSIFLLAIFLICIQSNSNGQSFNSGTLSIGGQISLFSSSPEESDIDAGMHLLPSIEFYPIHNFGLGSQILLDYSKITTPSKVTITTKKLIVPYLRYQINSIGLHAGTEVDLYYEYIRNIYSAISYSIFAGQRAVIEPTLSYIYYFGDNRDLNSKLYSGINFRWLILKGKKG